MLQMTVPNVTLTCINNMFCSVHNKPDTPFITARSKNPRVKQKRKKKEYIDPVYMT